MDWRLRTSMRKMIEKEEILIKTKTQAPCQIALTYPSPYNVAMSSLGFQSMYKMFNEHESVVCDRAFLPEDTGSYRKTNTPVFTAEKEQSISEYNIIAFSVAYELEIMGIFEILSLSKIPILRSERNDSHPLIIIGGPITFSNPLPFSIIADAIVMGEGENIVSSIVDIAMQTTTREEKWSSFAKQPGIFVPEIHNETLPGLLSVEKHQLPAHSVFITPNTELSNMFLIEAARGCSRGCTFCVMRRSTNGGMRIVPISKILSTIPQHVKKVGLVGASVSDHPHLVELIKTIVDNNQSVSLSSLRADKMTKELLTLFKKGGYKQLTVASDGASERIRTGLERKVQEKHLINAALLSKEVGMKALKIYMMLGVPGETDEDIDELIRFTKELSEILPIILGVSSFVAKKNTPLDGAPFEDIKILSQRLKKLESAIRPRAILRPTSPKWAWVEYRMAQGGKEMGIAAYYAYIQNGTFSAWKNSIETYANSITAPWRKDAINPISVLEMTQKQRIQPTQMPKADALIQNISKKIEINSNQNNLLYEI